MNTLKSGDLAYAGTFPCRVVAIVEATWLDILPVVTAVTVRMTSTTNAYRRGEVHTFPSEIVAPRTSVNRRTFVRTWPYIAIPDTAMVPA